MNGPTAQSGCRLTNWWKMPQPELGTARWAVSILTSAFSRRELFIWIVGILAATQLFRVNALQPGDPFGDALWRSLASRSAFQYLAWYVVFRLLADSRPSPLSRADLAVGFVASLSSLVMFGAMAWLVATAVGAYLWAASGGDSNLRSASVVLLALAFNALWAPQLFEVISYPLLWLDTALVGTALNLMQTGFTWRGTIIESPGHAIAIFGPCSSFHNISLGLLCWIALTKLARPEWVRSDVYVGLAVVAAVLCINTLRVYLMALNPAMYAYWHEGTGAEVFGWSMALVVLAISLAGVLRTTVRQ